MSYGYETERQEWLESNPLLTFHDYLKHTRGWSGRREPEDPEATGQP